MIPIGGTVVMLEVDLDLFEHALLHGRFVDFDVLLRSYGRVMDPTLFLRPDQNRHPDLAKSSFLTTRLLLQGPHNPNHLSADAEQGNEGNRGNNGLYKQKCFQMERGHIH